MPEPGPAVSAHAGLPGLAVVVAPATFNLGAPCGTDELINSCCFIKTVYESFSSYFFARYCM